MNKLRLNDGTEFLVEDGHGISDITHVAASEAAALDVCEAITAANISHIVFVDTVDETAITGEYFDLALAAAPIRQTNENGTVTVIINLREQTALEKRVSAVEDAVDFLLMQ